ncbi:MAG TPA: histidine phosphatase family protein [Quisquiliibacterium sp.]|nr:histidine phosphatase family protein [Quisquiliibacterium sp.]HPA90033.1 histidine phosphatase family protein [Quisquiliibacterium sp.]HQD82944.1 histidine phosphatase family protein [Quisquiliibacterium sp.]HQN13862.1 histidine phosphatase family protein [Quisquiliibacterium sp.]HQP67783.1 histidine phosphatase family protein [Quisquiliibacterium sp.]
MKLLLIRHPKPDVIEGTCYGRTDVPPEQADLAGLLERLRRRWRSGAHPPPRAVYSSPLQRCATVAGALAGDVWPHPTFDERIAEMHFGHWEGRLWAELPREEIAAWRADIAHHVPPGGESLSQMAQRAHAFAQELTARHPEDPDCEIVLMTHVGIIQTLPRMLLGEPLRGFAGNPIDYGSITRLVLRDGRFERDGTNMTP